MEFKEALELIERYEKRYSYDCAYLRELLQSSLVGFEKLQDSIPLSYHREYLTLEEFWTSRLSAIIIEDCGDYLQLNVRMALDAGVNRKLIKALVGNSALPDHLEDIRCFSKLMANRDIVERDLMLRLQKRFCSGAMLELGVSIASVAVFPMMKKALGQSIPCIITNIEVEPTSS